MTHAKRQYTEGLFDYFDTLERIGYTQDACKRRALEIKLGNIAIENRDHDAVANKYNTPFYNGRIKAQPMTVGDMIGITTHKLGDFNEQCN